MPDFTIPQGDLRPAITQTLTDANGPINLTSAAGVAFRATRADGYTFGGACSVTSPAMGVVAYVPQAGVPAVGETPATPGDTDEPGIYQCEFVIEWSEGVYQTVPNHRVATLEIR